MSAFVISLSAAESRSRLGDSNENGHHSPSRDTSVISSSSSSSSISIPSPPAPHRKLAASRSSSSLPNLGPNARGARPPGWLSIGFRDRAKPSEDHAPAITPSPSPKPATTGVVRYPMSSPEHFEFGEELGGGSWSTVVEAVHPPTSKRYAIKILYKSQLLKEKMTKYAVVEKNALAILSSDDRPGVVRLYSAFHDSTSLYLVLSLAPNGDLRDLVKRFGSLSLSCARYYTAQIVDTVQWIHSKGILHRDLKPENILLDSEMRIQITDFGSAYISKDSDTLPRASTFVGTAAYVSPELLASPLKTTSQSSDLWAIGCILFFLLVGQSPFLALNDYLSFKKIEALNYSFPEGFDSTAKDLVQRLLVLEPADRIGFPPKSSTSDLREHPFFQGQQNPLKSKEETNATDHLVATSFHITWETLWTEPPVPIESGLVPPPRPERQRGGREGDPFSWGGFCHEFSLITADGDGDADDDHAPEP